MIDLHYWPTPNGQKVAIFLEETGLAYKAVAVNIGKKQQFEPNFLAISPNNRIPAIVDHQPADSGAPISVFESGAILEYLADKTGKFLPAKVRDRVAVMQWVFWQMGGLGPMAGQNHHFAAAEEKIPYAIKRYVDETARLYGVLERQLAATGACVAGEYSIADMCIYPWIVPYERQSQKLEDYPHIKTWFTSIRSRPAVERAYSKGAELRNAA